MENQNDNQLPAKATSELKGLVRPAQEDRVLMVMESHFNALVRKVKCARQALEEIRDRGRYLEGDGCADLAEKVIAEIDAA